MKVFAVAFIVALLFSLLAGTLIVGKVQAATEVSGIITSDTTWTKANSPYDLTGPVRIAAGVTVLIEPGVTVNLYGYDVQVDGTLSARGTSANRITIAGSTVDAPLASPSQHGIIFTESSPDWDEQTGTGSIIENADINKVTISTSVKISNCQMSRSIIIRSGSSIISGNTAASIHVSGGSPTIINNNVYGGTYVNLPLGISGGSPYVAHNNITGVSYSDQYSRTIYIHNGIEIQGSDNALIIANLISGDFDNAAILVGQYGQDTASPNGNNPSIVGNSIDNTYGSTGIKITDSNASPSIQNNTIRLNTRSLDSTAITTASSSVKINYNNILPISRSIYLLSSATGDVNATYNWWGTTNATAIAQTIFDYKNNYNLGNVTFFPFLNAPNPQAPLISSFVEPFPSPSPSQSPTPTPSPAATPTQEPQQTEQEIVIGVVIAVAVIGAGLGLLVYLVKRK